MSDTHTHTLVAAYMRRPHEIKTLREMRRQLMYWTIIGQTLAFGDWRVHRLSNTRYAVVNLRTRNKRQFWCRGHNLNPAVIENIVKHIQKESQHVAESV